MKKYIHKTISALAFATLFGFSACDKEDPALPDNLVQFEATELGFTSTENELTINIPLSREAEAATSLSINLAGDGATYGTDFTTTPAASANTLSLPIAAAATQLSFKLTKVAGALFDGNEKIVFTISSAPTGLVLGEKTTLTVNFSEIIASGATVDVNGGGATFPNRVFIDLSANRQTAIKRDEWDFGFYQKDGEFKVILNSSLAMMAKATAKADINAVLPADSAGMRTTLHIDAFIPANMAHIDAPNGDLNALAIGNVSATESDNKVFIVNRGKNIDNTQRSWKKVRIIRNGTGYAIQHADIGATTFQTIQVTRNAAYLFTHVKLDNNAAVNIEPEKDKWDIAYSTFMNQTQSSGGIVPYVFNDIILQNHEGVETAMVMNTVSTYEAFAEANLTGITFGTTQTGVGSSWRIGGGPGVSPTVRTDRFYLVKDANGNIYKVKFLSLTQNGERGKPSFEFALVKKGI
jgi:hypothetical protein